MSKRIFWIVLPAAALICSACEFVDAGFDRVTIRGSGKIVSENRPVGGLHEVDLRSIGELTIDQGTTESLTVEADDNLLPKIKTEVFGGRLEIGVERGYSLRPSTTIRYRLQLRDVTVLRLSGSGSILAGRLHSGDLTAHVSGSGEIKLDELSADTLRAGISGSGNIEVAGKVDSQTLRISGSGDYQGGNLDSRSAEVTISGSGDSTLRVSDSLDAHISGSGGIDYYGNPRVTRSVSGSGHLRNIGQLP